MSQLIPSNGVTMSSVELVQLINDMREEGKAELRHDTFLAKVEKVLGEAHQNFLGTYKDRSNRESKCYHLPKREASLMVMSESYAVQAKVYDRWQELENAYGKKLRAGDEDWKRQRHIAASSYKVMSQLLQETRELEGKTSKPHHFMNEAKLVNASITGEFKGIDRDSLSIHELDLLGQIEIRNTILIARGFGYEERKKQLQAFAAAKLANSNQMALEVK